MSLAGGKKHAVGARVAKWDEDVNTLFEVYLKGEARWEVERGNE
jgi:hypothetical protein